MAFTVIVRTAIQQTFMNTIHKGKWQQKLHVTEAASLQSAANQHTYQWFIERKVCGVADAKATEINVALRDLGGLQLFKSHHTKLYLKLAIASYSVIRVRR